MSSCKKVQKKLQNVTPCQKSVNFKNIYIFTQSIILCWDVHLQDINNIELLPGSTCNSLASTNKKELHVTAHHVIENLCDCDLLCSTIIIDRFVTEEMPMPLPEVPTMPCPRCPKRKRNNRHLKANGEYSVQCGACLSKSRQYVIKSKKKKKSLSLLAQLEVLVGDILAEEGQEMQECPEIQERLRELNSKYEPTPVHRHRTSTREIEWWKINIIQTQDG